MSKVLVTEDYLEDIADAIRGKLSVQTQYKPGQMAAAIESIPTGVTPTGTINITENGDFDVTNYATASVDVSGGESYMMLVTATSYYYDWCSPLMAFGDQASNWWGMGTGGNGVLALKFDKPAIITEIGFSSTWISGTYHWSDNRVTFQCSDDGTTWTDLVDATNLVDSMDTYTEAQITSPTAHTYYRFVCYPNSSFWTGLGRVNLSIDGIGGATILSGTDYPTAAQGSDGDIYFRTSSAGVKNTAGQYIDTGYSGNARSKYVIDFTLDEEQTANWPILFGVRDSAGSVSNAAYYSASISERNYTGANIAWGNAANNIQGIGATAFVGKRTQIAMQSGSVDVTIDGVKSTYAITAGALTSTQAHLGIFAMIAGGYAQSFSYTNGMVLYSLKIYENDTLVHSYEAAKDGNDTPCVYDSVTQQYLYHGGGGSLTYVEAGIIQQVYVKINGSWVNAIGTDISEVIS